MKTFFSKIEAWFKKVFGNADFEKTAASTLKVIAPLVQTLVTLIGGPALGTVVGNVLNEVETDLGAAAVLIGQADANPTLSGILGSIQTNLPTILTDAQVKSSASFAKIQSIVNTVVEEISAIASALPTAA